MTVCIAASKPAAAATGPSVVIRYEVHGLGNTSSVDTFTMQAVQTYADNRGWNLGDSIAFQRVSSGGDFTLWLAAAGRVAGFGSPCDGGYSCRVGRNARGVPIRAGYPFGHIDQISTCLGSIRVRGWVIDPDTAASGPVHIYIGSGGTSLAANRPRPHVARAMPGYGPDHGFDFSISAVPGMYPVCVYGTNLTGPGGTTTLGCRNVVVPS
jgi:hypothetical protein